MSVSVSAVVSVAAELWTTSPNVSALGVEEEPVNVQSSTLVMSGEEEMVVMCVSTSFLCVLCVAVRVSSLLVCGNMEDV